MKKALIIAAIVILALIFVGLVNRENAKINYEAIEALPEPSTERNVPRTQAELDALQQQN